MNLNLYDSKLNRIAIIAENYISCLWSEGYNTLENFTLELVATDEYKKKVREGCYVGRTDRKTLMVIKTVEFTGSKIVASGKSATRILDDVAFVGTIENDSDIVNAIKSAYETSYQFPLLTFSESDVAASYPNQISNKSFLELCQTMCQDADVGFRVVKDKLALSVEFYQPTEKQNLVFSETFGNLSTDSITISTENMKNYAIVLGEGEGESRVRVVVDLSNGGIHRELIVDARDLQKEDDETTINYKKRLMARGYEKLLEQTDTFECAFTPYALDFGGKYDLGDILSIRLNDLGINLTARVTRFSQKSQNNSISTTVEVGKITVKR